ncbi:MAG: Hsp20/alpha crystallin family protein [Bacteroidota bacterium]
MLARINRSYVPAYWDDFFNDSFFNSFEKRASNSGSPAVNVVEEEKAFTIDVAVPGIPRDEIRIDLEEDLLTIASEERKSGDEKNRTFMRREFSYNTFKRSFRIPETVDLENIRARHDAGILTIELPKKEEVVEKAPRQIEIK